MARGPDRYVEIPYGLKIAEDGRHLEDYPAEMHVLIRVMEWIVLDKPLSGVAVELKRESLRNRDGKLWNPASVFYLLPRLIEAGPRIFGSDVWAERRQQLFKVVT